MSLRLAACAALVLAPAGAAAAPAAPAAPLLDGAWSDHALVQRDQPLALSGTAAPGAHIEVSLGAVRAAAVADAVGRWRVVLGGQPAASGLELAVIAPGAEQHFHDLAVGELFLCSGQSNMELAVDAADGAPATLAAPPNPAIRLLHIAHARAEAPQSRFATPPRWAIAASEPLRDFSAVCYYFGAALQRRLKVPVGLIEAAWGGTNIEVWVPGLALDTAGDYAAPLALIRRYASDRAGALGAFATQWQGWWRQAQPTGGEPWAGGDGLAWQPLPLPWRNWKEWGRAALAQYDGLVWFRRKVTLTSEQAAQGAVLDTGAIDEEDQAWVNARPVGNSFGWGEPRSYPLAPGTLHAGENSIVVAVYSAWDKGGMFGPAEAVKLRLANGGEIALGSGWEYLAPATNPGAPPHAPWHAIGGITGLYNAMIAPLGALRPKAVLWYQGESNTGDAGHYAALLGALRHGWREQFGAAVPFLIVQLPRFGARHDGPADSGWASLREAQRRAALADPVSALAVTIDTGDPANLHPTDKPAVASRLARAAGGLLYGDAIAASGAQPLAARREGGQVWVTLGGTGGALISRPPEVGPFELCGADQASCRRVRASVAGSRVLLGPADGATRVRYCWDDAPLCTLFDRSGRAVGPFEIMVDPDSASSKTQQSAKTALPAAVRKG